MAREHVSIAKVEKSKDARQKRGRHDEDDEEPEEVVSAEAENGDELANKPTVAGEDSAIGDDSDDNEDGLLKSALAITPAATQSHKRVCRKKWKSPTYTIYPTAYRSDPCAIDSCIFTICDLRADVVVARSVA
jgi:hypothetical protein